MAFVGYNLGVYSHLRTANVYGLLQMQHWHGIAPHHLLAELIQVRQILIRVQIWMVNIAIAFKTPRRQIGKAQCQPVASLGVMGGHVPVDITTAIVAIAR